jgi:DNA-binding phage protein
VRNVRVTHSELLRDPAVVAHYLNEALEDGDAAVIQMALTRIAQAHEDGITGSAARSEQGRESLESISPSSGLYESHIAVACVSGAD